MLSHTAFLLQLLVSLLMPSGSSRDVLANGNTRSAGRLNGTELSVSITADTGAWRPLGPAGPATQVAAFGEEGSELSVPGPMIRVREGTSVVMTMRNALAVELWVWGLCARPGPCTPIAIAPGASREVRFMLGAPGTYYYWGATAQATTIATRARKDSQLGGAIIVDPREGSEADRVLVISNYEDPPAQDPTETTTDETDIYSINGATWPHTERLRHKTDELVRWRVINLSGDQHAMHLHGFHFTVDATGDGVVDRSVAPSNRRLGVTEHMRAGSTLAIAWTPTRPGHWLFHCHMLVHMMPADGAHAGHTAPDDSSGMSGLVMGVEITGPAEASLPASRPPHRIGLGIREEPNRYGSAPGYTVELDAGAPRLNPGPVPAPILVVERGSPVEVTIRNHISQPTAIHWHGIELDSFFDGVPGFGGRPGSITPPIAPGESFVARFTPPRAGTYIYHTHWHDEAQLAGGIYGALLVLEPGERYDPAVDHVLIVGYNGAVVAGEREPIALNGYRDAIPAIRMRAGVPNRLRIINITTNNVAITTQLVDQFDAVQWTPLAKDGAALSAGQTAPRPARQLVSVGETYDFRVESATPRVLWFEVRRGNGEWLLQARVQIR